MADGDARLGWGRALLTGAGVGAVLGAVVGVALVLTGYPSWGQGVWAFSVILAPLVLALAGWLQLMTRLLWWYLQRRRRSGRRPLPGDAYRWIRPAVWAGAAAGVLAACLTALYRLGPGVSSPF